jgi:hypothetical protein
MPQRLVRVKVRENHQTITRRTVVLDTEDAAAVRALLRDLLRPYGVKEPGQEHALWIYDDKGRWIGEVTAA